MANPTGFLEIDRSDRAYRPVAERLKHWDEFVEPLPAAATRKQAERCMDCGIPFCHSGCPVNNLIPEWNDLVHRDDWRAAIDRPDIGRRFIAVAADSLRPGGKLWLVANRHLPYESVLSESFDSVRTVVQQHGYKIIEAVRAKAARKSARAAR